jgi:phosphoglycerate dehydrogenase-like enzyme
MRLAILDDYQGLALKMADWSRARGVTVVSFKDHVFDPDELVNRLSDFDAVLRIRERTEFPRDVLTRLPRLKLILATGMRNAKSLDLATADKQGIVVCTTDALHQTTVELVWALILNLTRRVIEEAASVRAGGWQNGLGFGLAGRTLGIVGLGNMGIPVASVGRALGMKVIAWSPNLTTARASVHGVQAVSKEKLFQDADVITIHMPLSSTTVGLIGSNEIAAMKSQSYLINTARPQLVDQVALIDALTHGRIGGAGLDVYEIEPLPAGHPYRTLTNVIATPHIGFVTQENYRIFYQESLENLLAFLDGKPIRRIDSAAPFLPDSQVAVQHSGTP